MSKITSLDIKIALMEYFRFKRQFICAEEVFCQGMADILVDTGSSIIEVEVKISKSDLIHGEAKKPKHNRISKYSPNLFYVCVPTDLIQIGKEWVNKVNKKYGIIEYYNGCRVITIKRAGKLHKEYSIVYQKNIIMRCSSMAVDRLRRIRQVNELRNRYKI